MSSINTALKVDSCKLSIPLSKCKILNKDLQDYFIDVRINTDTGEQTELKNHSGIPFIKTCADDDTYIRIWIEPQINYNAVTKQRSSEDYITLLVNSKHLQGDYFKGITKDTIKILHSYMMSLEVFKCSYSSFCNARYSDIDIAFDFKCNEDNFSILKQNITKSAINETYFHTLTQKDNSGIWTPTKRKPREQATPLKPYVKFYSKQIDFETKSNKFASKYFKPSDYENLVRFECTIKNTLHKKRLNINQYSTFISFLNSDLQATASIIFNEYFKKAKFVKLGKFTPMDRLVIDLINECIDKGTTKTKIFQMFNRYDVDKNSRKRLIEKYHTIYSSDEINKKKLEANQITEDVFSFLGVDLTQIKLDL
jgi:hypothetical protein